MFIVDALLNPIRQTLSNNTLNGFPNIGATNVQKRLEAIDEILGALVTTTFQILKQTSYYLLPTSNNGRMSSNRVGQQ